jgi:hypothetical protein
MEKAIGSCGWVRRWGQKGQKGQKGQEVGILSSAEANLYRKLSEHSAMLTKWYSNGCKMVRSRMVVEWWSNGGRMVVAWWSTGGRLVHLIEKVEKSLASWCRPALTSLAQFLLFKKESSEPGPSCPTRCER